MTVDELIAAVVAAECDAVPPLLARHLPLLGAHGGEILGRLLAHDRDHDWNNLHRAAPTHPAGVAVYWLEACIVTDGAFSVGPRAVRTLTPFGAALLARVGRAGAADPDLATPLAPDATPTDEELTLLAAIIAEQRESGDLANAFLMLLGRVARAAFALAPVSRIAGREALAATADALADHLIATIDPYDMEEMRDHLTAEASALRGLAATLGRAREEETIAALSAARARAADDPTAPATAAEFAGRLLERGRELFEQGRPVEAREPLREAVAQYRHLAGGDDAFRPQLAKALAALGGSLVPLDQIAALMQELEPGDDVLAAIARLSTPALAEGARAEEEARDLFLALAAEDGEEFSPRLANCLAMLGMVRLIQGDPAGAEEALIEARTIFESFDDDPAHASSLANVQYMLILVAQFAILGQTGGLHGPEEMQPETTDELYAIVERLRPLAARDPDFAPRLAGAAMSLGLLLAAQEEFVPAARALEEAEAIYTALDGSEREDGIALIRVRAFLSRVLVHRGEPDAARPYARGVAAAVSARLSAGETTRADRHGLLHALLVSGEALSEMGEDGGDDDRDEDDVPEAEGRARTSASERADDDAALEAFTEAVVLARALHREDERYADDLTQGLLNLARILDRLRRTTEVVRVLEEAQRVADPLTQAWLSRKQPGWELLARLYLAFDDPAYLDRAIAAAADKEPMIRRLLTVVRSEHDENLVDVIEALAAFNTGLIATGRRTEAMTVRLLALWMFNRQMHFSDQWSPGERALTLQKMENVTDDMVRLCAALNDVPCRARCLFARATVMLQSLRGATPGAIRDLEEAADRYRSLVRRDPDFRFALGGVLKNLAGAYSQGSDRTSDREFEAVEESVGLYRELAAENPAFRMELIEALNNFGAAHLFLPGAPVAPDEPRRHFERALMKSEPKTAYLMAFGVLGEALNLTLEVMDEEGETERGRDAKAARMNALHNISVVAWLLDDNTVALGTLDEARGYFDTLCAADAAWRGGIVKTTGTPDDPGAPTDAPSADLIRSGIRMYALRGRILRDVARSAQSGFDAAFAAFETAIGLLEQYLAALPGQDDQLRFIGSEGTIYQETIAVCLAAADAARGGHERQRWHERAWEYAERSRARITQQTLLASAASESARTARAQALHEWVRLNRELDGLYAQLRQMRDTSGRQSQGFRMAAEAEPQARAAMEAQIVAHEERIARARRDIHSLLAIEPPNLAVVQHLLREIPDGATIIEAYLLTDRLVFFILDGDALHVERVNLHPAEIAEMAVSFGAAVERTIRALDEGRAIRTAYAALDDAVDRIGARLLPALRSHLDRMPTPSPEAPERVPHLLLIPAGDLHALPLHALPLDGETRLIDRYAVSYLPAAMSLDLLARQPARSGPYYGVVPPTNLSNALALPQAWMEAAMLGGAVRDGRDATFDTVCAELQGGTFACITHGRADLQNPERSGIQLASPDPARWAAHAAAQVPGAGADEDTAAPEPPVEWVTALEFLIGLERARCELLLLWGCQTHGSGAQSGDNWLGATRAFLGAGKSVVASLWRIYDDATLCVSLQFCTGLKAGLTVPQALRTAMRAVRDADADAVFAWGGRIGASVPPGPDRAFRRRWTALIEDFRASEETGAQLALPNALVFWAPFVAIGWPGAIALPSLPSTHLEGALFEEER